MDATRKTATRREWTGLAVLALPTLLASLDMSVLFLALPHLSADLHAGSTQQLWILDSYGFMLAGFLVTMGTLGDRIGRRRLLMIGASLFGAASVLAAYSTSPQMLIAARAVLGVAGATLMPSTLALIRTMFTDARQRGVAIAAWMSCFMAGTAIGPLIGGVLLEWFWWGSVFLLAVPVMVVLLATAPALLPESRDPHAGRVDPVSVALSLAAILPVVYGIKELTRGASPLALAAIPAGLAFGVAFVARQRRLAHPLLDLRLFGERSFRACLGIMFGGAIVMAGTFLFIPVFFQQVLGFSPLKAGLWTLPPTVAMIAGAQLTPVLARRFRPAPVMAVSLLVAALGCVLITQVSVTGGLPPLVAGFLLACAGVAPPTALGTDLLIGAVPPARAGSAAAVSETSNELGIAIGLATFGSIGAAVYAGHVAVPAGVPAAAGESLNGAVALAGALPERVAGPLLDSARTAYTLGLNTVALLGSVLFAALAVVAVAMLRRPTDEFANPPALHGHTSTNSGGDNHGEGHVGHVDVARRVRHRPGRQPRVPARRRRRAAAPLA
ncbi:MAG TPA: MFS transporter [Actinophytocola sp.]|jgi:DHA2 family multidrug resistance protein-like MFS transporter|nr:MFS transporter [Actinophytocola sp.]